MPNGYLQRECTSTGNQKTLTISFWTKIAKLSNNGRTVFSSGYNTSATDRNQIDVVFAGNDRFQFEQYGRPAPDANNTNYYSRDLEKKHRDTSAWSHVLISFDSTLDEQYDRAKVYINGIREDKDSSTNAFPQNYELPIGNLANQVGIRIGAGVGAMQYAGTYFHGSVSDYFFIDGQALGPEDFGYYKKGDGYMSVGLGYSTHFKKGQWVPKAPKIIKSIINAKGGFGTNGFYLPFNDSSNPGADLHCTPNSIFKLPGEDEQQPYFGSLPTTTDNYVSLLREDSYADNLVLAVPGASLTNGIALDDTELIDSTGWVDYAGDNATVTVSSGTVTVDNGASNVNGRAISAAFNTTVGQSYKISFKAVSNTGSAGFYTEIRQSNGFGTTQTFNAGTTLGIHEFSFVATETSHTYTLYALATGGSTTYSDISIKETHDLIGNGSFDYNTTGWSAGNSAILSIVDGALKIQGDGTTINGFASKPITTVVGQRYTVNFDVVDSSSSSAWIRIGTTSGGTQVASENANAKGTHSISFTATNTTTYITLMITVGIATRYTIVDNVVVKKEDVPRDYSADIKGSGTNKTIELAHSYGALDTTGIGYNIDSYYGSAIHFYYASSDGLLFDWGKSNPDYDFGTGDFTMEAWVKRTEASNDYWSIFRSKNYNDGVPDGEAGIAFYARDEFIRIWDRSGGSTNDLTGDVGHVPLKQWTHIAISRDNGRLRTFCDGVCVSDVANTVNYSNNGFEMGQNFPFDGYVQDARIYKGVAKYKGSFDVPKLFNPVDFGSWRTSSENTDNNFAHLNGAEINSKFTISNGGLSLSNTTNSWTGWCTGTIGFSTGKWYWETRMDYSTNYHIFGIINSSIQHHNIADAYFYGMTYQSDGRFYAENNGGSSFSTGNPTASSAGKIVSIAVDMDAKRMWLGIDGTWTGGGNPAAGTSSNWDSSRAAWDTHYVPVFQMYGTSGVTVNFGQNPSFCGKITPGSYTDSNGRGRFKYEVPNGFLALCEDNLPTPSIKDPGEHFKAVMWNGDGAAGHAVTGVGFKPDLVWLKERTNSSSHQWHDSVRGAGNLLMSNVTEGESFSSTYLYSFDTDGFTLGTSGGVNAVSDDYIAWCWKAGGAAVTNNAGTIESQVSANQTAGFSIVSYTGNGTSGTVGHGLGSAPNVILVKNRDDTSNWSFNGNVGGLIYGTNKFVLQDNNQLIADTNEVTSVSETTFTLGNSGATNGSSDGHIAYCWREIEGYSKFGSYTGNTNSDGPFVYCGFKPAFVMVKSADRNDSWGIFDSSRDSVNPVQNLLRAEGSNIEATMQSLVSNPFADFLSTGFKIRNTSTIDNYSGEDYFFMAFAESPFKTANAK